MPFEKHKDKEVKDLPTKYLLWLTKNVKLYGELEAEVYGTLGIEPPVKLTDEQRVDQIVRDMGILLTEYDWQQEAPQAPQNGSEITSR